MRIHRTPDAEAAGGGEAAPPEKPAPVVAKVVIPPDVQAQLDKLAVLEAKQSERDKADKAREDAELARKGEYEKLIANEKAENAKLAEKARDAEERAKRTTRDRELALALSGQNLRTGAAKHLTKLLADELEVVATADGGYETRSKDRRSVADFVADTLKLPDFDAFVSSTARPGAGSDATKADATKAAPVAPAQPRTLGEALVNVWTDARSHPDNSLSQPRGIRRKV